MRTEAILRIAGLVGRGEWTSYGDISAAALGHKRAARLVGNLAAVDPRFPNAHRVLTSEGRVSRPDGRVETARGRLRGEGVAFGGGRADPSRRVHWDELQRRDGKQARHRG